MGTPQHTPVLSATRILLRPFRASDVEGRMRCGNDPGIIRMFGGSPQSDVFMPTSRDEAEAWYQHVSTDPNPLHWADEHERRFIGTARLHEFDETDRRARYAVGLLDAGLLGIGLGTEVTRTVLHHAFNDLELHRVDLRVLAYNARAIACYSKCGFIQEGREREAARVDGAWHDDLIMGILDREFDGAAAG